MNKELQINGRRRGLNDRKRVVVYVTQDELDEIMRAASGVRLSTSTFCANLILDQSRKINRSARNR